MPDSPSPPPSDETSSKGLAALPPKVLSIILDRLEHPIPENIYIRGYPAPQQEAEIQKRDVLRNLSLVNDEIRKLAQPLLWTKIRLGYDENQIRRRTDSLRRLFSARPESTSWVMDLAICLDSYARPQADVLQQIAEVISKLNDVTSLHTTGIYDVLNQAPSQLFANLTELSIGSVGKTFDTFLSILSRCPNLTRLSVQDGHMAESRIGFFAIDIMPSLTHLEAPMGLATRLIQGRPIEDLSIAPSQWRTCTENGTRSYWLDVLPPLTGATTPLRRLSVSSLMWSDNLIHVLAQHFPLLEKLHLNVTGAYNAWLEDHLLEAVLLFPALHTLKVICADPLNMVKGNGPPSTEKLEVEMQDLEAVSQVRPCLKEVSYLPDVTWFGDGAGFWFALYRGTSGRKMFLTPRNPPPKQANHSVTTDRPTRHPNDRFSNLPTEVLLSFMKALRDPERRHYSSHLALLSLCLTSERLRSIAQPLLFSKISLKGKVRETLFVARRLEEMFNTRDGSAEWVKELALQWELPNELSSNFPLPLFGHPTGNRNPVVEPEVEAEMVRVAFSLLERMSNLREFKVEQIALPQELYAQLCRLPRLKHATFSGFTYPDSPSDSDLPTHTLTLTRLAVLRGRPSMRRSAYTMPRAALRLARSSSLHELRLWQLTSEAVAEVIGPQQLVLVNLQALEISDESSPFQRLLDISQYTPNLQSLSLGHSVDDIDPMAPPSPPAALPASIPLTTWPHLKSFRGSLQASKLFAPYRPLEKLEIFGPGDEMVAGMLGGEPETQEVSTEVLAILARATGTLKHLVLVNFAWRAGCVEEIASLFPDLETLRIMGIGPRENWLVGHLVDVVRGLPKLCTVHVAPLYHSEPCALAREVLDEHARVILAAKALCPSLVAVSWNGTGRWNFEDERPRGRWVFKDAWRTEYSTPVEQ